MIANALVRTYTDRISGYYCEVQILRIVQNKGVNLFLYSCRVLFFQKHGIHEICTH